MISAQQAEITQFNKAVAAHWKENFDLVDIMRRNWDKGLGAKLEGKIHIYVGEADNYYLNNAVYLADDFLKNTKNPCGTAPKG